MALATQPGIAVNANIMCQTNMISLREKYFPQIDKAPASQPAVTWQKVFLCHEQCLKCSETNLRWQYMYVGGLICQKTVDWSHFGSSEVIQRFCPRSQRVVATVCLFVKSGVKWHLLTNRQTVTLSTQISMSLWQTCRRCRGARSCGWARSISRGWRRPPLSDRCWSSEGRFGRCRRRGLPQ